MEKAAQRKIQLFLAAAVVVSGLGVVVGGRLFPAWSYQLDLVFRTVFWVGVIAWFAFRIHRRKSW